MRKILGIGLITVALFVVFTKADDEEKEMSIDDIGKKMLKRLELEKGATGKEICDAYAKKTEKMKEGKKDKERKKRESDDEEKGKKKGKSGGCAGVFKELTDAVNKACKDDDVKPETIYKAVQPYAQKLAKFWKEKGGKGKGKKDKDDDA